MCCNPSRDDIPDYKYYYVDYYIKWLFLLSFQDYEAFHLANEDDQLYEFLGMERPAENIQNGFSTVSVYPLWLFIIIILRWQKRHKL